MPERPVEDLSYPDTKTYDVLEETLGQPFSVPCCLYFRSMNHQAAWKDPRKVAHGNMNLDHVFYFIQANHFGFFSCSSLRNRRFSDERSLSWPTWTNSSFDSCWHSAIGEDRFSLMKRPKKSGRNLGKRRQTFNRRLFSFLRFGHRIHFPLCPFFFPTN